MSTTPVAVAATPVQPSTRTRSSNSSSNNNNYVPEKRVTDSTLTLEMLADLGMILIGEVGIPVKMKQSQTTEDSITFIPLENSRFFMTAKNQNAKSCTIKLYDKRGQLFDFEPVIRVLTKNPQREHTFHLSHLDLIIYIQTPPVYIDKSASFFYLMGKRANNNQIIPHQYKPQRIDEQEEGGSVDSSGSEDAGDLDDTQTIPLLRSKAIVAASSLEFLASGGHNTTSSSSSTSNAATVIIPGPTASAIPLENPISRSSLMTVTSNNSTISGKTQSQSQPNSNEQLPILTPAAITRPVANTTTTTTTTTTSSSSSSLTTMPTITSSNSNTLSLAPTVPLSSSSTTNNTTSSSNNNTHPMPILLHPEASNDSKISAETESSHNNNNNNYNTTNPTFFWPTVTHYPPTLKRRADISPTDLRQQPARSLVEKKELLCLAEQTTDLIMDICPPICYNQEFKDTVMQYIYYSNQMAAHKMRKLNL